jgi:hypothetical protein
MEEGNFKANCAVIRRTRSKVWRIQGIYAISSKSGKFPVNIRVVAVREAYTEDPAKSLRTIAHSVRLQGFALVSYRLLTPHGW